MRNLDLVIQTMAAALNVPEGTVRSRWMLLRKAGLWSKVGRGRDMPDPTPSDITNLLLSFLAGGLATETAETVRIVRGSQGSRPPIAGLEEVWDGTLGTVLDGVLSRLATEGELTIREDHWAEHIEGMHWKTADRRRAMQENLRIGYASLSIRRNWLGWQTEFGVARRDTGWLFGCNFAAALPDNEELLSEKNPARMLELLRSRNVVQPNRVTTETVGYPTLAALAACLNADAAAAGEALNWRSHTRVRRSGLLDLLPGAHADMRSGTISVVERDPDHQAWLVQEHALEEKPQRGVRGDRSRARTRRGQR